MIKYLSFVGGLLLSLGTQAQCPALSPAALPFTEDFESYTGTVEPSANDSVFNCSSTYKWDFHRAGASGRLSFATTAYTGSQSAVMDATSGYDTNYTTLTVNLSSYNASSDNIVLSFYYRENGDEALEPADRVWIRGSSTDSYIEILDWNAEGNGSTWTLGRFKMDSILTANSQSFSSTTQIRWGQSDNTAWSGPDGFAFDDVSIVEETCPQPSGLTATNTGTSIDVNWTTGGASAWQVSYGPAGSAPGQNITNVTGSLPYTITGLGSGGTYDVYVRDSCAVGDVSFWTGPVSVSVAYVPPYLEDWSNGYPNDWTEAQGLISDSTVFTSTSSSSWGSGSFNGVGSTSARINIWSTGTDEWLISPSIDLGTGNTYQLNFQAGLTQWGNTSSSTMGVDDTVKVVISTDNGITWSDTNTLIALSSADAIANGSGSYYAVSLAGYSGVVKIAFYAESTQSNADNYFYVDDIEVRIPPACPKPTALASSNITKTSIDLTWQSGGSGPWYIHWGPCGFNQGSITHIDTATAMPYTLSGLNPGTSYEYRLIERCGSDFSDTVNGGCFATSCDALALPLIEGFNSTSATEMCWTVRDDNSDGDMWDMDYGSNEYEGDGVAMMNTDFNSGANDDWLISPALALSGNDRLIFQYRVQSSFEPNDFELLLSTTGSNPSDFTDTLMPLTSFSNTTYQEMTVNLSAFSDTVYIAWHVPQGGLDGWRLYIDEVIVENIPPCLAPVGFQATSIGWDSIQVNWSSDAGALGHRIEYGLAGFAPGTGTMMSANDTFAVIKPLIAQTSYDFYITDTCAAGYSTTEGPFTYRTSCTPFTAPFLETFDGTSWGVGTSFGSNDSIDPCWTRNSESGYKWSVYNGTTSSSNTGPDVDHTGGGNFLYTEASSTSPSQAILISPYIDVSGLTTPYVNFWYHRYGSVSNMGDMTVEINDGSGWVTVLTQTGTEQTSGSDPFKELGANISSFGDTIQVRFVSTAKSCCAGDMAIDDFEVKEAPSCPPILNLGANNIVDTAATFVWGASANATSYQVWFGPQGFFQGTQTTGGAMVIVPYDSLLVDTLSDLTCYEFLVRGICAPGDSSSWAGPYSFCTPPSCPAPTNLGVDPLSLTLTSADIYWTSGGASDYNVEYGPAGFTQGAGTMINATNDTLSLSSLSAGTEYEFYVRDSCGAGDVSLWEGPFSFVTPFSTNYLEDFTLSSPFGWTEADGRLTSNTVFTSTTSSSWTADDFANTGTNNAQNVNIWLASQYEWLISPSIYLDPTITNLQVELDVAVTAYNSNSQGYFGSDDSLVVVISTDNGATWSSTNVLWYADNSDTVDFNGEHIIVPLTGYSGYVKFGIYAGSVVDDTPDNDFFVDNFEVRTPRACPFPTGLSVSDIGTDSALVSWTEGSAGFINAEVIYTLGNQPASAGTIVNSANDSMVLTGLTNATAYCVYIVEECANGFSDTIGPVCFSTLCLPQNLPYTENFNVSLGCFTAIDGGSTPDTWFHTPSYGGSTLDGTPFAFVDSDGAGSGNHVSERLESVQLDASGISNPLVLTFDHYYNNISSDSAIVEVFDGVQWVMVTSYTADQGGWGAPARDSLDITAYANAALQVRFRYEDDNVWAWYWAVDNVRIYEVSCPAPTNVVANALGCDSVEVSWNSGTNTTSSTIVFGAKGFAPPAGTVITNATSPYLITGLAMNTEYEVYVVDSCSMDVSFPVGPVAVKTDSVGPVLASFTHTQSDTTANDATVDFDATASTGDGLTYDWDFGNGNTGTGMNASGTYTSNGSFSVKLTVTDRCGNTDDTTITVVVTHISISENLYNVGIDVYPNPSNGNFKVNISGENSAYAIEVTDLSGKVVYKNANLKGGQEQEVNLGNVASGVYLIRISGNGLNATQRIMID